MKKKLGVYLLGLGSVCSYAQTSDVNQNQNTRDAMSGKAIQAIRIARPSDAPRIDGQLDEALWKNNPAYQGLHQISPDEYAPGTELTRFWVAYDEDHLYVAAQVYDDPKRVVALQPIQGKAVESDDQIHISIDPFNTDRDGYFFQTNPNGLRTQSLIGTVSSNPNWRAIWDSAAQINDEGWAVEMAIPFKSLSFDPRNSTWGFNIGRVIRRKGEFQAWSSRGRDIWEMGPTVMADLSPIENVRQGRGLDIQVTGVASHVHRQGLGSDSDAEPSLDVFYKPTPNITLAATLNTDFSSTEVDDRIVNLSRFDVQLPEKRDFFLRDSTQFTFAGLVDNGMPFFSRRIGLGETGESVALEGGAKFFGRFGDTDVGALVVRQEASGEQQHDADLLVVRMKRNLFEESQLGFIYTEGDPFSDEKNRVIGADFNYNKSDAWGWGGLRGGAWYQRVYEDTHTSLGEMDQHALGASFGFTRNQYDVNWNYREIGRGFNPALGFVNRRDIRRHSLDVSRTHFFNGDFLGRSWLKSWRPNITAEYVSDTRDLKQDYQIDLSPFALESVGGDTFSLVYTRRFERLAENFFPVPSLSVQPGDYDADRVRINLTSSIARRFHASAEWGVGDFYDGDKRDQLYSLGWRPLRNWYLTLGHEIAELELPSGEFTTRLSRVGSELAITRDWAWLLLAQYDNVTRELGVNSRLRWLPRAGQELALVVNNLQERRMDDRYQTLVEDYRVKMAYTLRF